MFNLYRVCQAFRRAQSTLTRELSKTAKPSPPFNEEEAAKKLSAEFERIKKDPVLGPILKDGIKKTKERQTDPSYRPGPPITKGWDETFKKEEENREHSAY